MKGKFNVHDPRNIVKMHPSWHTWLHNLFWCLHTPKDQFEKINWIWKPIQSEIIKDLFEVFKSIPEDQRYADWMYKK